MKKAEQYFHTAIKTLTERNPNPYDGEPYYNLGWSLKMQGKYDEAYSAYYKATWNAAWRDAGYFGVAQIDSIRKKYWNAALEHVDLALIHNWHNHKARQLKASILRHSGETEKALKFIEESLTIDKFNLGCRFEKYFIGNNLTELQEMTTFSSVRFILLFCHKQQITSFVNVKKITFAFILTVKVCAV